MSRHPVHSLTSRATLSILAVVLLVGAFCLALSYLLSAYRETQQMQMQLKELFDTVERPASIACFLQDAQLAGEVANGLLANSNVREAVIDAGSVTLARAERDGSTADVGLEETGAVGFVARRIVSPFDPGEIVGEIRIVPNQTELQRRIARTSLFVAALMLVQILAVGVTVALVVYGFVTRPLKQVVAALLGLRAEQGVRLPTLSRHKYDEIGELIAYINRLLDRLMGFVEHERDLRRELAIEGQRFRSIFENAQSGIFLLDGAGTVLSYNPACWRLLQSPGTAKKAGDKPLHLGALFKDEAQARRFIALCKQQNQSIHRDIQLDGTTVGGVARWVQLTLTPIGDQMLQGVVNDITERKEAEAMALRAARTDPLTGLLNRAGFVDALRERFKPDVGVPRSWVALLVIDLDLFKAVNDTYGHAAGDRVLKSVAKRLRRLVRRSDPVGRFGGDEFVVLLSGVDELGIVEKVSRKIVADVAREIALGDGRTVRVGVSVGIALSPIESANGVQLFKEADEAMYQAKKEGRNTYRFYDLLCWEAPQRTIAPLRH
ncbi:PAS domain S-box/diguanylate cyclase (GGDEF) domain-containing protein [Thioflavicoccus mobilis 8321]|uniref:PAS domain S-box/diguanylate cyclase (GGDEF) domain-containing protein n=1 Tax=Thioflavicoccus mobilis 8321 TaxID=765912 RepID=L0GYS6_9GAMM|nr:sensor domain-containing diguanylate cyclase [Thioflavicoccus mobilis]AGA91933.1 PAS domain S-box/diguanylate cyclase (GGDEF) domain-containing protein [Thioflavicoccus mobilis 8321]